MRDSRRIIPRHLVLGVLVVSLPTWAACGDDGGPADSGDVAGTMDVADGAADAPEPDGVGGDAEDAGPDASPTTTGSLQAGEHTRLEVGDGSVLRLVHRDEALLRLPLDGVVIGVVPSLDETLNYDPYYLEGGDDFENLYTPPDGLAWHAVEAVASVETTTGGLEVILAMDDGRDATLVVTSPADGRFAVDWTVGAGDPAVMFRLRPRVDAEEGFYGLGEVFDRVEHRGTVRAMQFEPASLESGYNERHVPVPLLLGTTGWGVFVESYRPGVFAMATEADDEVKITFAPGPAWEEGLRFHLFAEDHPLDLTRHYYEVTGFPGAVARYALGPWIWRDEVAGQDAVEADLQTIRDLDLATTGYWIDRPYASGVNSFDFDPATYDDPAAMMDLTHDLGFRMALWHTPYVDPEDEDTADLYAYAEEHGFFAPELQTALANWGPPLDFSNPEAFDWWQERLQPYVDLGIVGYKLDYAEEVIAGAFGTRITASFHDGTNELTMHRRYQNLYHRAYAELLPEDGGFLLCRAGSWGDQVNGVIVWPGDIDASFAPHGEEYTDAGGETYVAVGGVPAAVVAGSSLGPSGFPYFGSDTGGYRHAPPDRETYVRWFEHTALSTVMQVGTNTNDLPWAFGDDEVLDEEMLGWYRRYARLHLRLWPYMWSYVDRLQSDGRALQRPLGLAHPELGVHPSFTYLLGDHLLVAPVVAPGVTERDVTLPEGTWVDWWTGDRHQGGDSVTLDAPLDTIPFLVRAGAPVPMLRPTIDTLNPVADPDTVDSFATEAGPLHVRVTLGPESSFTLYDGTAVTQARSNEILHLERSAGDEFDGAVVFEVFGLHTPVVSVADGDGGTLESQPDADALAGVDAGWTVLAERGGTLLVKLPAGVDAADVTLGLE
ncbi:MAG: TIM-barrel domain-containing protein [Myxococcota bacterium]